MTEGNSNEKRPGGIPGLDQNAPDLAPLGLSSLTIRRPVFTLVLAMAILLFGALGLSQLGVREFPAADRPVISVTASYPGADATVIENQITEPLENEINTVAGIRTMTSVSREGRSTITVEFGLGDDLDVAANDVRDRVAAAARRLPDDVEPPTIRKADADGEPIVFLNISSRQRDLLELTEIADNIFRSRLQTIPGVARVDIWGSKEYAMRLWMDPDRLAAHGMTALDVREALARANVELPSGRLEADQVELGVRTLSRLRDDPAQFDALIVRQEGDRAIRFSDLGRVELGPLNERTLLKRDGVPMVGVVLRPQTGANEIAIVDEFYRRLAAIERELPPDVRTAIGFDTSVFVRQSVAEVRQTIFIALALVCLVIFLFLREWRSTVIPLVTIPIALVGAFFLIYLAGFTVNVLTLLGLVLAIGLVVDDAVIVLENVYRRIEQGIEPMEAGIHGIREIFLAVVATTLALVAVFLPILFLGGLTGMLFREFGLTLAGAVVLSSFIALTLTPMLCTRLLVQREQHPWFYRRTEPFFRAMNEGYRHSLELVLRARWVALLIMAGCLVAIVAAWMVLPRELAPREDRSLLLLQIRGPQGANYEYMGRVMDEVDAMVAAEVPEARAVISVTSPGFGAATTINSGFARLVLVPAAARRRTQDEIARDLEQGLREIPGAEIFVSQQPTIRIGLTRGLPVQFVVQNPEFRRLREVLPEFLEQARERPEFSFVDVNLEFNQPELELEIDRTRAANLGVSVSAIAETVQAALSGQRYGFFIRGGRQYEVIGQLTRSGRSDPSDLSRLLVRSSNGRLIRLDSVAAWRETVSPPVLYRYNRFPSATFSANLAAGATLGEGIAAMREVAAGVLDETFTTELSGEAGEYEEAAGGLGFVFVLALIMVYLVLAAQFESFRSPFIIMLTVPLAVAGGMAALWAFGLTLNIFSQIGLIMLIGLVTKNGILLVEFANQRLNRGMDRLEAIREAAARRFRPILMTAISTIFGVLPIAVAFGAGAQSRIPLGVAVIGGLLAGTLFTLYVIPAAYSVLAPRQGLGLADHEAGWSAQTTPTASAAKPGPG
jgi:multidrug efflux pump